MKIELPKEDGLYTLNGNRVLYFQDGEWFKPIRHMKRYSGYIEKLTSQPKNIKSIEKFKQI